MNQGPVGSTDDRGRLRKEENNGSREPEGKAAGQVPKWAGKCRFGWNDKPNFHVLFREAAALAVNGWGDNSI